MRCVVIIQRKRDGSSMVQANRQMVLEDWDKGRVDKLGDEAGSWEVLYCSTGLSFLSFKFFLCSFSFHFIPFVSCSPPPFNFFFAY